MHAAARWLSDGDPHQHQRRFLKAHPPGELPTSAPEARIREHGAVE
ncbi:MAG: hypothetical protein OJF49_002483 [Ktedonobacterales bacterium]|nr:MAG: hypothetical protein OJF49_002483 [Ktedonobacterales bacterium]